jgi:hypothetical protein
MMLGVSSYDDEYDHHIFSDNLNYFVLFNWELKTDNWK